VTEDAPPDRSGVRSDAVGVVGRAAVGGTAAFLALVATCELLGVAAFVLTRVYGLWSWAKIGLLTAFLSLRTELIATVQGSQLLPPAAGSRTIHVRFVPMLLTIGFLWLAARAGRRAARTASGRPALVRAALAAGGAAVPAAILAAACSTLVDLSFPGLGLRLQVDAASAALWGGALAAAGAAAGAYLEAARGRAPADAFRGGLTAYGWALGLLVVGVLVVATLEPTVTRRYVDGVTGLGSGGGVLFGYHLLALPAQSALLLAPASGSCVEVLGQGSIYEVCPWRLTASGPGGGVLVPDPIPLSPWFWSLGVVPAVAAMLGGRRAAAGITDARRAIGLGVAAGSLFALLVLVGAWLAAPRWFTTPVVVPNEIPFSHITFALDRGRTMIAALVWGIVGGGLGAWFATRSYAEPELPRPTSA
jgi:hypothetical protein